MSSDRPVRSSNAYRFSEKREKRRKNRKTGQPEPRDYSETSVCAGPLSNQMPRRNRCVLSGVACHITQRGVDRRETFSCHQDRTTYLRLLSDNLRDAQASLL